MPLITGIDDAVLLVFGFIALALSVTFVVGMKRAITPAHNNVPVAATRPANADEADRNSLDNCAICLERMDLPCSTNCGHVFCAPCVIAYLDHMRGRVPTCPLCRRTITLLVRRGWTEDESQSEAGARSHRRLHACVAHSDDVYLMRSAVSEAICTF